MKKLIYTLLILALSGNIALAQQGDNVKAIDRIIGSMNTKDAPALLAMMADTARIGNLPQMNNRIAVPEILAKFSAIKAFNIVNQTKLPSGDELIQVEVTYQDGKPGKPSFLFNREGKLVNLGIIKGRMKGNPEKALSDALASSDRPETIIVPFKLVNGLVYLESTLNGMKGYFQFDSGAPVVILRKKFVPNDKIRSDVSVDLAGIGGQMQHVVWSTHNSLQIGGIVLKDLEAPVAEMEDKQLEDGGVIFGLLGIGVLKNYQFTLDYGRQELLLEKLNDKGELLAKAIDKGPILAQYPLRLKRHIPIVDIMFGDKVYPMGIDCGANANLLKKSVEQELKPYIDYEEGEVDIKGANGISRGNSLAYMIQGKVGKLALQDMYTVITEYAIGGGTGNDALPIEGLLGTPFLNQYKMTLNFNKQTISFY